MKTCAECQYIQIEKVLNACFAFCEETGSVVPQVFDAEKDPSAISLTRVPAWCPLAGVDGRAPRETPPPKAEWQPIPLTKE